MVKPSIRDGFIFIIIKKRHSFECQHSIVSRIGLFVSQIRIEMVRI